jgi:hypothetical protein
MFIACTSKATNSNTISPKTDTLYLRDTIRIKDSNSFKQAKYDSLLVVLKKTKSELFVANYKIGQIKYRVRICKKNPNLKKFFFGWVNRLVAD